MLNSIVAVQECDATKAKDQQCRQVHKSSLQLKRTNHQHV